jgi:hypothetical protein
MKTLKEQFDSITLLKIFEIEVTRKDTGETDYVVFDISIDDIKLIAQHEATTQDELDSNKIAFCSIELDEEFSLDMNLQVLYSECVQKIIDSDFFTLAN